MDYVALQVKTSYSLLDSLNDIKKLVEKASSLGYTSLAITDTNNMFGVMEFYLECQKNNIKPIIGLELHIDEKKILLYAKNNNGYKNLIKLSTLKSERDLTIEDLKYYKDNLILIMPFLYYQKEIYSIYQEHYIGYSIVEEKNKIKEKKVYINDVSYLNKGDYIYLDYLKMIKYGKTLGEYELNKDIGKHLLNISEVEMFSSKEDILISKEIADSCNVVIDYTPDLLPIYDPKINAFTYLSSLCNKGLKRRLNDNVDDIYQNRLDYELDVINKMGFCNYFLIVWDYVKYAKFHNIMVGAGRGSAAGSLVSYTLGITDIDPIKYNLLFERFLNPERVTMPDIDIDFDANRKNEVIDYVTEKYGEKKVAGIITFNTLAAKQVIRDVGRVMNISLSIIDEVSKSIKEDDLMTSYSNSRKLKNLIDTNSELKKLFEVSIHLEGLPRHVSVHAAGIVMSRNDIDEVIPLYKNQLGQYVTAYSMNYLESLGLLKMDFLSLSNLTLISEIIENIRHDKKINITFEKIPMDDKKTLELFRNADTDGIFQFETSGMKRFLEKLQVRNFDDLVAAIALFRPGPMENIDTYIKTRDGKEQIFYLHPDLKEILEPTYGIIIYQEQIMQIARILAGYTLGEADILRRAMSKKKEEILLKERPKFIRQSIKRGYTEEISNQVFDLILKFANYGFNKAHSVAYSVIAYKMAFLKTYFPIYFLTSILNNSIGSEMKTKNYIMEIRNKKINILCPDINKSDYKYKIENGSVRCPLSIIKNVGIANCNEIIKEREKGEFVNFLDFAKRTNLNKKILNSLILAGCFREYNKKTLIENLDNIINYADLAKDAGMIEIEAPILIEYDEYSKNELTEIEFNSFGFYLSEHPVSQYKKEDKINLLNIKDYFDKSVNIVLYVENIKEISTKNNDIMAFITCGDEYGSISLTMFPKIYSQYNSIQKGDIVKAYGKVEKRFENYQIIVNSMIILNK